MTLKIAVLSALLVSAAPSLAFAQDNAQKNAELKQLYARIRQAIKNKQARRMCP